MEKDKFIEHLNKISEEVFSWPEWKRDVLRIEKNQVEMPPEFSKIIKEHFWELFEE